MPLLKVTAAPDAASLGQRGERQYPIGGGTEIGALDEDRASSADGDTWPPHGRATVRDWTSDGDRQFPRAADVIIRTAAIDRRTPDTGNPPRRCLDPYIWPIGICCIIDGSPLQPLPLHFSIFIPGLPLGVPALLPDMPVIPGIESV